MKVRRVILATAMVMTCAGQAGAGIEFSFDMNPLTDEMESHRTVAVGEKFDVAIMVSLTEQSLMAAYGFSVRFDTDELDFVERIETPPSPLMELDGSNPLLDPAGNDDATLGAANYGQLTRFDGVALFGNAEAPLLHKVATLTFTAAKPTGDQGDIDLVAGLFDEGFDGILYRNGGEMLPVEASFSPGSVSAVPEPGGLALVGVSLLCLGGWQLRRRRRN